MKSTTGLSEKFIDSVEQQQLFKKTDPLLVACSGGVDSVVLCELLFRTGYQFSIAHCNFQLRGEASAADEAFVRELAERYEIPVFIKSFETALYAETEKISIQLAARQLRYDWFNELMQEHRMDYLLTAHHADDHAETVLMNLFKGTGISGMHGILAKQDRLIRPLLFASKKDIITFAQEEKLSWREDASNATDKYTRNFFRNQVIPLIETMVPNASNNIKQSIAHLQEAETLYEQRMAQIRKKLIQIKGNEVHIPVLSLANMTPLNTIAYELIKDFGFSPAQLPDFLSLLKADTGRFINSATHRIIKNRKWLIVAPLQAELSHTIVIEKKDEEVLFADGKLILSHTDNLQPATHIETATLDAKDIRFPLILRKWKAGDYFYPLGMPKKKKVARFLIDQKLSTTEKEKVWVVESNKKILWVVGYRIDDRFKITSKTKQVLKIKWLKLGGLR